MERAVMPSSIKILSINADDTLCQNNEFFRLDQDHFVYMLISYILPDKFYGHLLATAERNLSLDGYGIKSFVLWIMETAVNVSQTQVPAHVVHDILKYGALYVKSPH